jgi:hypothetical protein
MEPSPYKILAVGIIAGGLSGWGMISLYTSNTSLTTNDLEYFSAILDRSEEIGGGKRSTHLLLHLKDQPLPFLSGVEYPGSYNSTVMASLTPGANIRVGCDRKYVKNPGFNRTINQNIYYIDTLEINNQPALTLEASNAGKARNAQVGKIITPIMFFGSVALIFAGTSRLQKKKQQPKIAMSPTKSVVKTRK